MLNTSNDVKMIETSLSKTDKAGKSHVTFYLCNAVNLNFTNVNFMSIFYCNFAIA